MPLGGRVIGDCRVWSQGLTGSRGPGLTWGPTVQQLHKVGWEGSQLPVLLSQPPAVLNLRRGLDAGASRSAPKVSLEIVLLVLPQFWLMTTSILAASVSHVCVPHPPPHFCHLLSPGDALHHLPQILSSLIPYLLYHFHYLPSLQLQLICLLRAVVEVHFAPSLGAPRFGRVTWNGT